MKILPEIYYAVPWERCSDQITIHDARKKLPFADNSVDYIYSSHLIYLFSKTETTELLHECYRVLKNQGLIRLATTDLEKIANNYVKAVARVRDNFDKNGSLASEVFLSFIFEPGTTRSYMPFRQKPQWRRSWIYDYQSLARLLESCGFAKIKKRDYTVGEMPDINLLDNRPDHSLYVEAKKSQNAKQRS
jgi:predicted SAM-dependent methyltransferase